MQIEEFRLTEKEVVEIHDKACSLLFYAFKPISNTSHPKEETTVLVAIANTAADRGWNAGDKHGFKRGIKAAVDAINKEGGYIES